MLDPPDLFAFVPAFVVPVDLVPFDLVAVASVGLLLNSLELLAAAADAAGLAT